MIAIGFVALLAGYTLTYWGGSLMLGQHIPLGCLLLNKGCPTSSAPTSGNSGQKTPGTNLVPGVGKPFNPSIH